jgi:GT2 family glycosyltransferase
MKIGFVATNYNNSHYTVKFVESVLKNAGHEIFVVIVDNASNEEDKKNLRMICVDHPCVKVINLITNIGYFGGLNEGLKYAKLTYPDHGWIVIGNNDLEFPNDFCNKIAELQDVLKVHAVISPDIITLDGLHQNPHVIKTISAIRLMIYEVYFANYVIGLSVHKIAKWLGVIARRKDMDQWKAAQSIEQGHGSCYVLSPRFFRLFDSLWSPTFMMAEELFLSLQLKEKSEKVFYTPEISVLHHMHGALNAVPRRKRWDMERVAYIISKKYQ